MSKTQPGKEEAKARKPLVWLHGEIKTPPFSFEGRQEAGMLLRLLQEGNVLGMPQAEALPDVGALCGFATRSTTGESCIASMQMLS
jgi:hypothetical protein